MADAMLSAVSVSAHLVALLLLVGHEPTVSPVTSIQAAPRCLDCLECSECLECLEWPMMLYTLDTSLVVLVNYSN